MIAFNPTQILSTASAADALLSLIILIENPDRARQFLADLKAALAENGRAVGLAEVEKHRAEIEAQRRVNDDRRNQLDGLAVTLGDQARSLNEREAALAARLDRLRALVPEAA